MVDTSYVNVYMLLDQVNRVKKIDNASAISGGGQTSKLCRRPLWMAPSTLEHDIFATIVYDTQ